MTTLFALAFALLTLASALPIPPPHEQVLHRRAPAPTPAPLPPPVSPYARHAQVPVPQGGSFHNETHWWVPDTVHHGLVDGPKGDNTHVAGRRVQMHVVKGRAMTSWA